MSSFSDVKQCIPLTADGLAQKYVNTTATNISAGRIMGVYGQATGTDAEIKIYDEGDGSKTASKLVFHAKFSNADNHGQSFDVPGLGIKCESGLYVDLTNCDFCTIIGTFS